MHICICRQTLRQRQSAVVWSPFPMPTSSARLRSHRKPRTMLRSRTPKSPSKVGGTPVIAGAPVFVETQSSAAC